MNATVDALVVGGGPAGASVALLLARAGWRVVVVEKAVYPRRKVCGEFISATTWPLLRRLGVADELLAIAGPAVRRVGILHGADEITACLAANGERDREGGTDAGHALGREHLDTVLLQRAASAGAEVLQPWTLADYAEDDEGHACRLVEKRGGRERELRARLVVAAHGSWEPGVLPTQGRRAAAGAADLFGFKAHFRDSALAADLMPLIAFPGGYGGLVHSDGDRTSLSCCVRRDRLERSRSRYPHLGAGLAVQAHIEASCAGVARALAPSTLDGHWLSAGPLRTGIRSFGGGRLLAVGNAAAEAHPIVAEGISMAVQSAFLLCELLVAQQAWRLPTTQVDALRREYEAAWRRNFSRRLHVAAALAHVFMRPLGADAATRALRLLPGLLPMGARWSGKLQPFRAARQFEPS